MIEISSWDRCGGAPIFVHQNLLQERSPYFKTLIENGTVGEHGRVTIKLCPALSVSYAPCTMFVRWLYGQPLGLKSEDYTDNLWILTSLYDVACKAERESGIMDNEFVNACLEAI